MADIIKIRRGDKYQLPILHDGEPGYCIDTNEFFIGTESGNRKPNQEDIDNIYDVLNEVNTELNKVDKHLKDIAIDITLPPYNMNPDGVTDNLESFTSLINNYPNGCKVIIPKGNFYISDMNLLPNIIQNFIFEGVYGSQLTFGEVCGSATNVIPNVLDIPNFIGCKFNNIKFSAPNAKGYAIFSSGSRYLKFTDCVISDVKSHFLQGTEDHIVFKGCKFEAPTTPNGTCMQTIGNVTQYFVVENCEWNFAPNQGSGCLISATNDTRLIGDYYFVNNRFLTNDIDGYYLDTFIDLEPHNATIPIKNVIIKDNVSYNAKIYIGSVDNVIVKDNHIFFTERCTGGAAGAAIEGTQAYDCAKIGRIVIENNTINCANNITYNYKQPIVFTLKNTLDHLIIKQNKLVVNGAMVADASAIIINTTMHTLKRLEIEDNDIRYTSIPNTPQPTILILTEGNNTVNEIIIQNNKVVGNASSLFKQTNAGTQSTVKRIVLKYNNVIDANLGSFIEGSNNIVENYITENNAGYIKPFNSPTLINGWVHKDVNIFNPLGYRKDDEKGIVTLRGVISGGQKGSIICVLPIEYRPKKEVPIIVYTDDGNLTSSFGRITIAPDGVVKLSNGETSYVSLENIQYSIN